MKKFLLASAVAVTAMSTAFAFSSSEASAAPGLKVSTTKTSVFRCWVKPDDGSGKPQYVYFTNTSGSDIPHGVKLVVKYSLGDKYEFVNTRTLVNPGTWLRGSTKGLLWGAAQKGVRSCTVTATFVPQYICKTPKTSFARNCHDPIPRE